jgi:hypothetical protein
MIHDIITSLLALPRSILAFLAVSERFSHGKGRHREQR